MKILIIEDENLLANELQRTLQRICSDCEILGVIKSVGDGVKWFENNDSPDLIISDIQLTDGTSFEMFNQVNTDAPIIFTTAYDEFAIKAFKLNSIDYLLKPINDNELIKAVEKYKSNWENKPVLDPEVFKSLLAQSETPTYRNHYLVKVGDQYKRVNTTDISFFFAEGNTVFIVKKDNKKLIVDFSLEQIYDQLDPSYFFRVNRNLILRSTSITGIHKYFNSRLKLEIQPNHREDVLVTRSRVPDFLTWLNY